MNMGGQARLIIWLFHGCCWELFARPLFRVIVEPISMATFVDAIAFD